MNQQELRGQFDDNNAEEVVPNMPGQLAGDQENIPPQDGHHGNQAPAQQDGHQDNQPPAQQPAAVQIPPIGPPMPLAWMPRLVLRPFVIPRPVMMPRPRPNFVELKRITRPRKFFQMPGRKMI